MTPERKAEARKLLAVPMPEEARPLGQGDTCRLFDDLKTALREALGALDAAEAELALVQAILLQAPQAPITDNIAYFDWVKSYREWWIRRLQGTAIESNRTALTEIRDAEIARLRGIIEKAPHGFDCDLVYIENACSMHGGKCNCWKSEAL